MGYSAVIDWDFLIRFSAIWLRFSTHWREPAISLAIWWLSRIYSLSQKSLDKMTIGDALYFEVGSHYLIFWASISPKWCWNSGSKLDESTSTSYWGWGWGGRQEDYMLAEVQNIPRCLTRIVAQVNRGHCLVGD